LLGTGLGSVWSKGSYSTACTGSRQIGVTMAVPKRRQSNARTGSRRAHDHKKAKQLVYCDHCSQAVPPHVVCPNCGHYMGRNVVKTES
jgi:large subunit ribosomal protein L32